MLTKILIGLNIVLVVLCLLLFTRGNGHAGVSHEHSDLKSQIVSEVMSQVDQAIVTQLEDIKPEYKRVAQTSANRILDANLPELVITPAEEAPEPAAVDPVQQEKHRIAAERYKATLAASTNAVKPSPDK